MQTNYYITQKTIKNSVYFLLILFCSQFINIKNTDANIQNNHTNIIYESNLNSQVSIKIADNTEAILSELKIKATKNNLQQESLSKIIIWVAKELLHSPYEANLLYNPLTTPSTHPLVNNNHQEYLYISLTKTDCMLFIEEVVAISILIKHQQLSLDNFISYIKLLRYHNSNTTNNTHNNIEYCNRNHYFKDWALMNIQQNLFTDIAYSLTQASYPYHAEIMSLMFFDKIHKDNLITTQLTTKINTLSDNYNSNISDNGVMADSNDKLLKYYNCIEDRERWINDNKNILGFIKITDIMKYKNYLHDGDIVGIVRSSEHMHADAIHHLGFIINNQNQTEKTLSMIHASSKKDIRQVIITKDLLAYLNSFSDIKGIVILRIKEDI